MEKTFDEVYDKIVEELRGNLTDEEYNQLSREEQEIYLESKARVSESVVTDEIRRDLLAIGWIVVDSELQDY